MSRQLLDASALLALLMEEPGAEAVVAALLAGALISSVNWSETLAKLLEIGIPLGEAKDALDRLQLRFIPFERSHAETCAVLREPTRSAGLSLADRACLATALVERLVVLTADRAWGTLDLSLDIRCIR